MNICSECKVILTELEQENYGDLCLTCSKNHAESFPERIKKLGEEKEE